MAEMLKVAMEHGPFAAMLVALCAYHFWWTKNNRKERESVRLDHKEERKAWRETHETLHKETSAVVRDNNAALRELTKVIAESNKKKSR
jgi:hypothetical protein